MSITGSNAGYEGKSLNATLFDALTQVRQEEGGQMESKIKQGRFLVSFEIGYKIRWPNGDAFKSLAIKSKEVPGLSRYTARTFRNLASVASLYDEIVAEAKKTGSNADLMPPSVSISHYLAVCVGRLDLGKKVQLLSLAKDKRWSVKRLKERVNETLGTVLPEPLNKFGAAFKLTAMQATRALANLTKLVAGNDSLEPEQLDALVRLTTLIEFYRKALSAVVPKERNSVPTSKAV